MSETLRKSDVAVRLSEANGDAAVDDDSEPVAVAARRRGAVEPRLGTVTALPTSVVRDHEVAARDVYFAELELRLRELIEVEKMRDLEIRCLESEGEKQAARIHALEIALFHSERRANELERRWNALAQVYEAAAASLVVAGGTLEAVQQQTSYRAVMAANRLLRRVPVVRDLLQRLAARLRTTVPPRH